MKLQQSFDIVKANDLICSFRYVAPKDMVLRAYMLCSFDKPRRVLIDQFGMVFTTGHDSGGWANRQDCSITTYFDNGTFKRHGPTYRFIILPKPIKMWDSNELWEHWWTAKAWKDPAWSWMHFNRDGAKYWNE